MVRNGTTKALLCFLLVTLFCTQAWQPVASSTSLETPSEVHHAGPATRIVISSPVYAMTADEVTMFEATLYDAVNTVASGQVNWSSSNGTITEDGTFYPWQSGLVTIQASSGSLVDVFNITVNAGVGQSLRIVTTTAHARVPTTLHADLM